VLQMCRSNEIELMDADGASLEDLTRSYVQIDRVNQLLGNTGTMLRLLKENSSPHQRVLDIGCGHGALLMRIRESLNVNVVGVDLRPAPPNTSVPILTGNAVSDPLPDADVTICMLLAHHLSEKELAAMICNVSKSSRRFVLLDLVRHPVPLALFRAFLSPMLSRINAKDGQTSIRRAYTAPEMRRVVDDALCTLDRPVSRLRHTVAPLWIRQVVDICWEPTV
jgi:SAM-dependent methyltransferase